MLPPPAPLARLGSLVDGQLPAADRFQFNSCPQLPGLPRWLQTRRSGASVKIFKTSTDNGWPGHLGGDADRG